MARTTFYTDTYTTDILPTVQSWMASANNYMSSSLLGIINRSQRNLWEEKFWEGLITDVALTLSGSTASLPSDFGKIPDGGVYSDLDGDGKPDYRYYREGDNGQGYKIRDAFVVATGHSFSITFYGSVPSAAWLRYQKSLTDFTGSGTEYSYFPCELILLGVQRLFYLESGQPEKYSVVVPEYEAALKRYAYSHQYNNSSPFMGFNDTRGNKIYFDSLSLDGDASQHFSHVSNAYLP